MVAAARIDVLADAVGLTRNQIDRAVRRRPEIRVVGVIAHRVALRVIPKRRDGVAVVVAHREPGGAEIGVPVGGGPAVPTENGKASIKP